LKPRTGRRECKTIIERIFGIVVIHLYAAIIRWQAEIEDTAFTRCVLRFGNNTNTFKKLYKFRIVVQESGVLSIHDKIAKSGIYRNPEHWGLGFAAVVCTIVWFGLKSHFTQGLGNIVIELGVGI
jgi:hypothetical protein